MTASGKFLGCSEAVIRERRLPNFSDEWLQVGEEISRRAANVGFTPELASCIAQRNSQLWPVRAGVAARKRTEVNIKGVPTTVRTGRGAVVRSNIGDRLFLPRAGPIACRQVDASRFSRAPLLVAVRQRRCTHPPGSSAESPHPTRRSSRTGPGVHKPLHWLLKSAHHWQPTRDPHRAARHPPERGGRRPRGYPDRRFVDGL